MDSTLHVQVGVILEHPPNQYPLPKERELTEVLIVPTLRVGMPPGTLRVPFQHQR